MTLAALFRNPFGTSSATPLSGGRKLDVSDAPPDVRRSIRDHRYFQVLAPEDGIEFDPVSIACAWRAVEHEMALIPQGDVHVRDENAKAIGNDVAIDAEAASQTSVDAHFIDRMAVTNADFLRFVESDCYAKPDLWPQEILPTVLQFVDRTGRPGPSDWVNGQPPRTHLDHPVVGICWYEANAYAKWIGKRLPTSAEWQRAGTWSRSADNSPVEVRYPWGNSFDVAKANLWASGIRTTVAVTEYGASDTANGVRQLIGNVWEWINTQYVVGVANGADVYMPEPMAEIRGGAFDTYFHSQATCQFRTGQPLTCRHGNIGFRCCRGLDGLAEKPDTTTENAS